MVIVMNENISFYVPPFPRIKSYHDMIDLAAEYHLPAIETLSKFELETPDKEEAKRLKEYADEKGVVFSCVSVFCNLVEEDSDASIQRMKEYAEIAQIVGSPFLHHTVIPYLKDPKLVLSHRDEMFEKGVKGVREVFDYAQDLGVRAIYEDQGYLFNGVEGFGKFLETVDRDVGVVADFGNISQVEESIEGFIKAFQDRVVHVHLKDVILSDTVEKGAGWIETINDKSFRETPIGKGVVDFPKMIALLKNAGYKGFYSLEYSADRDDSPYMKDMIKLFDQMING